MSLLGVMAVLGAAGAIAGLGIKKGLEPVNVDPMDDFLLSELADEELEDASINSNKAYLEWLEERDPGADYFVKTNFLTGEMKAWSVQRLWDLGAEEQRERVRIKDIPQAESSWFWGAEVPSVRETAEECARITRADLRYPIILDPDGSLMDGAHRLGKAIELGHKDIWAVRLSEMPEPDEIMYF